MKIEKIDFNNKYELIKYKNRQKTCQPLLMNKKEKLDRKLDIIA